MCAVVSRPHFGDIQSLALNFSCLRQHFLLKFLLMWDQAFLKYIPSPVTCKHTSSFPLRHHVQIKIKLHNSYSKKKRVGCIPSASHFIFLHTPLHLGTNHSDLYFWYLFMLSMHVIGNINTSRQKIMQSHRSIFSTLSCSYQPVRSNPAQYNYTHIPTAIKYHPALSRDFVKLALHKPTRLHALHLFL